MRPITFDQNTLCFQNQLIIFDWEFLWIIPETWQAQDLEHAIAIPKSSFLFAFLG